MKITLLFFYSLFILFLFSCEHQNNTTSTFDTEAPQPIDSSKYYDSIYKPLALSLDTFFQSKHDKTQFYGNVLFAEKGRIIFEKVYAYDHKRSKDSISIDHTFQMASASKPFTALAILQLCEQGLISLDDSINNFFPEFPYKGINIHQLLCHRSGMSQYTHFCDAPDSIWPDKNKTIYNNDVLDIISTYKPLINYTPNRKYYYCNTNYVILASIVEKISGYSFSEYLKKNIFSPSGMMSTVLFTRDNMDELIHPTTGYNAFYNKTDNIYLNGCVGDKGVFSNLHDLLAFDRALKNNILIRKETYDLAIKNHNEMFKINQNYGYGFRLIYSEKKGKIVFHTGWWKGFRTYFIRILNTDQTIIILSNVKRGPFLKVDALAELLP